MMKVSAFCPDRRVFESRSVESLVLCGSEGQIEILPGHAQMVGSLETGRVSFLFPEGRRDAVVSHGFFRVEGDEVTVLAGTLEFADDIDLERAETAYRKAETALKAATDARDLTRLGRKLKRAEIRRDLAKSRAH